MSTSPVYAETEPAAREPAEQVPERIRRLEGEISELRDTIARFADLMIGEVKDLRKARTELPTMPPGIAGELPAAAPPVPSRRPWLLTEFFRDLGTSLRMYLDPRYRVRRATQLMVPLLLALFVLNGLFFNHVFTVTLLSPALEKAGDIVLAVLLYKVISRELERYRQVIAQLVAWQDYRDRTVVVGGEPPVTPLETD
jgi:hypothetical protein